MERILAAALPPRRRGLLAWLGRLAELRRQRLALARLTAAQLDDAGITPEARRDELARRAWDVPAHWLR